MKNNVIRTASIFLTALFIFLAFSCTDILNPRPKINSPESAKGGVKITIDDGNENERTVLPLSHVERYILSFISSGSASHENVEVLPGNTAEVNLPDGTWTITANGYAEGITQPIASGTSTVTISGTATNVTIEVSMMDETKTGTLQVEIPDSISSFTLDIWKYSEKDDSSKVIPLSETSSELLTETGYSLNAGAYWMVLTANEIEYVDVVYIYPNQNTVWNLSKIGNQLKITITGLENENGNNAAIYLYANGSDIPVDEYPLAKDTMPIESGIAAFSLDDGQYGTAFSASGDYVIMLTLGGNEYVYTRGQTFNGIDDTLPKYFVSDGASIAWDDFSIVPITITINGIPEAENSNSATVLIYSGGEDLLNGDTTKLIASGSAIVADGTVKIPLKKPDSTAFASSSGVYAIALDFGSGKRYVFTDGDSLASLADGDGIYLNTNYTRLPLTTLPIRVSFDFEQFVPLELLPILSIEEDWTFTKGSDSITEGEEVELTITFEDSDEDLDYEFIPVLEQFDENNTWIEIFDYEGYNDGPPLPNTASPNGKTITVRLSYLPLYENNLRLRLKKEDSDPAIYYPIKQMNVFDDEIIVDYYELDPIQVNEAPPLPRPTILAVVPKTESGENRDFTVHWTIPSNHADVTRMTITMGTPTIISKVDETNTWVATTVGAGTATDPYRTGISRTAETVGSTLSMTLHGAEGDSLPGTDNPANYTAESPFQIYAGNVTDDGGNGNGILPASPASLNNVFNNILDRYSNVNVIVHADGSIDLAAADTYTIPYGKTITIEAGTEYTSTIQADTSIASLFTVAPGGNLTIKGSDDGTQTLTLVGIDTAMASLIDVNDGEFTMDEGAVLSENKLSLTGSTGGGAVSVVNGGTFTMTGGEISGNTATYGGGVYVSGANAEFTMNDGTISGNNATDGGGVYLDGGTFTMTDGTIGQSSPDGQQVIPVNTAGQNGGGVYVTSGTFNMSGGFIKGDFDNTTLEAQSGGGVYLASGWFRMNNSASVEGNSASSNGGGVYLASGNMSMNNTVNISGNTATSDGGGVYVDAGVTFNMNSGTIGGNDAYVGKGVYTLGTFNMNGGTITLNGNDDETSGGNTSLSGKIGSGGGVYVGGGTFTMNAVTEDASIEYNYAELGGGVNVSGGTFEMKGSREPKISHNEATDGGGVVIVDGKLSMITGSIRYNSAQYGGGVCVYPNQEFEMSGGDISENTASDGGAVYVNGTFNMVYGNIYENSAVLDGGGVYVTTNAVFNHGDGGISGNTAGTYGGGVRHFDTGDDPASGSFIFNPDKVGQITMNIDGTTGADSDNIYPLLPSEVTVTITLDDLQEESFIDEESSTLNTLPFIIDVKDGWTVIEWYLDEVQQTLMQSPTTSVTPGEHSVTIIARDSTNNLYSNNLTVTVE
jgi:hypothetical protein